MRATGWKAFWLWAVAGALLSFAVLAIMSIGLYLLPVAIIVTVLIARRASAWPETLGVLEGAAATALWVAFISAGVPLCSKEGQMSMVVVAPRSGETIRTGCTTSDYRQWMWAGATLALSGLATFGLLQKRRRQSF